MPLYEYECQQCHRRTEKRQKFSDPEITDCPHCGGHLERVLSAPAFSFAGGGWYKDLYSSAKPGNTSGDNKGSDTKANSDSKPASGGNDSSSGSSTPAAPSTPAPAAAPSSSSSDKK